MAKIRQIQDGSFVGKVKTPKEVQRLIEKYRLENSGNPSAVVMMMMVKLHRGEKLPEPLRGTPHRDFGELPRAGAGGREAAGGSGGHTSYGGGGGGGGGRHPERDRERERDRDRERDRCERDRERDRRRSRSRGRRADDRGDVRQ